MSQPQQQQLDPIPPAMRQALTNIAHEYGIPPENIRVGSPSSEAIRLQKELELFRKDLKSYAAYQNVEDRVHAKSNAVMEDLAIRLGSMSGFLLDLQDDFKKSVRDDLKEIETLASKAASLADGFETTVTCIKREIVEIKSRYLSAVENIDNIIVGTQARTSLIPKQTLENRVLSIFQTHPEEVINYSNLEAKLRISDRRSRASLRSSIAKFIDNKLIVRVDAGYFKWNPNQRKR